ncbi:Hypothetical predicted protein, partial [Paramuricea clavata]
MPASAKKKPNQEKLLFIRFDILVERCKALISTANDSLESYKPEGATSMFDKISSVSNDLTEAFSSWLLHATDLEDERVFSAKSVYNEIAKSTDDVLVRLRAIAPVSSPPAAASPSKPSSSSPRLRKIDFRPLDKSATKNWFEDLEIVFKAMGVIEENLRYASLLRLIDTQTSNLLSSISREQPSDAYSKAKKTLIAQIEVLFEDLSLDDVRKFTVLRHAPPAVRLQLAGSDFDTKNFTDLVREADHLTQRARQDALVVGAIHGRGRGNFSNSGKKQGKPIEESKESHRAPPVSENGILQQQFSLANPWPPAISPRPFSSTVGSFSQNSSSKRSQPFQVGNFMVDSGSPVTIVPVLPEEKHLPSQDSGLVSASGAPILMYGSVPVSIPINKKIYNFTASKCDV